MLCAISGEAPQVPVVSRKNGHVFEKRLIEAHIKEHHTDPVTGEDLEVDDLLELKSARTLKPRPPTLTSIPSLLSAFQNEWDAIALETYNLRKELAQTRQELSTALYQHDAATRVIARVVKERDEARKTLSSLEINAGGATNGDAMQVDSVGMSDDLKDMVTATESELRTQRRANLQKEKEHREGKGGPREDLADWATAEDIQSFDSTQTSESSYHGGRTLALDSTQDLAIVATDKGSAGIYSISKQETLQSIPTGAPITAATWWGSRQVIGLANGAIKIYENGAEIGVLGSHAGTVTALSLHPSGKLLGSAGVDKSVVFYDLSTMSIAARIYIESEVTCGVFHPDGKMFCTGNRDGLLRFIDVVTLEQVGEVTTGSPVTSLVFSENGSWLASASQGQTSVAIWNLPKVDMKNENLPERSQNAKSYDLEIGSTVDSLAWDFSGTFLAAAGPGGIVVQGVHYVSKKTREWTEALRKAIPSKSVQWGAKSKALVALTAKDHITVLAAS